MNKSKRERIVKIRAEIEKTATTIDLLRKKIEITDATRKQLYIAYLKDEYSLEEYTREIARIFEGKTPENWKDEKLQEITQQQQKLSELEEKIRKIEEERETRNYAPIIAVLLIAVGITGLLYATGILRTRITGLAILENESATYNETENGTGNLTIPETTQNLSSWENITTQNATEVTTQENITIIETNETNQTSENITSESNETGITETSTNITENITQNISEEIPQENKTSEQTIENIPQNITENITQNISEEVTQNITEKAPVLTKEIPTITLEINESAIINLSEYFTEENGRELSYIAIGADGLTITIEKEIAEIRAEESGYYTIKFAASNTNEITYSNEVEVEVLPQQKTAIECIFNPIILTENYTTINLREYCTGGKDQNITYSVIESANIRAETKGEILNIWKEDQSTGLGYVILEASTGEIKSRFTIIIEMFEKGVIIISQEFVQSKAEIGKPVEWTHKISLRKVSNETQTIDIVLPKDAKNITVYKRYGSLNIQVTEALVSVDNKTENIENYNRGETQIQSSVQTITGAAIKTTRSITDFAERVVSFVYKIFAELSRITGFAVYSEENTTTLILEENASQENITTGSVLQATENQTVTQEITTENGTAETSENVVIQEKEEENGTSAQTLTEIPQVAKEVTPPAKIDEAIKLIIPEKDEETQYLIRFTTPAPEKIEEKPTKDQNTWKKKVTIRSESYIHYENTTAYSSIPESLPEQVKLFWIVNGTKQDVTNDERFNVQLIDLNGNGRVEKVVWTVPLLSEEEFELQIDLIIITVQSFPMIGGNWTTAFNTTGTANLIITAYNGTTYREEPNDNNETEDDLRFIELKCGNNIINKNRIIVISNASCTDGKIENSTLGCTSDGELSYINYTTLMDSELSIPVISIMVENYNCSTTSYYTVNVLTGGKHTQQFRFGNKTAYAYNMAGLPIVTLESPVNNSIIHTGTLLKFTISGANASWYNIDGGTNNTLNAPYYINTTNLTDQQTHTITIYANNSLGDIGTYIYSFMFNNSAYGHLEPYYVWPYEPYGNTTVPYQKFFTFKAGVRCVGGPCGDLNATLDPLELHKMLEDSIKRKIEEYLNSQSYNETGRKFRVDWNGVIVTDYNQEEVNYLISVSPDEK
ncbi:MAG: hypothetical protein QW471_03685 [Candidatus Woesearchaeota archaeon]